ncbi:hypothetical protein BJV77DRAFT_1066214 [Russula vinacea]|nr:hypothetical protein BJV77DRAFT_1066214 [Russula vinacea]
MQAQPIVQQPQPVKIYNAVYSSVQVYECMVRGIAVMRRRADSYVNATQILKVAGVDKGRRTKILEKEILPAPSPQQFRQVVVQRGITALFSSLCTDYAGICTPSLEPRACTRSITPSTSQHQGLVYPPPPGVVYPGSPAPVVSGVSPTPPPIQPLKRTRSEMEAGSTGIPDTIHSLMTAQGSPSSAAAAPQSNADDNPDIPPTPSYPGSYGETTAFQPINGAVHSDDGLTVTLNGAYANGTTDAEEPKTRFASKPDIPRNMDPTLPLKDHRRAAIITAVLQRDDPNAVLELIRDIPLENGAPGFYVDCVLDELGHTALHISASLGRLKVVEALIANGADVHRGNYNGETPLIRACLLSNNFDQQSFGELVSLLHPSIRTLDTARKSVLHHVVALAGVRNRAIIASYYLDQIFLWIAQHQDGDFRPVVDLQDEHGDTALNIAARAPTDTPNKLGLRPGDFGVENEELGGGPRVEDLIASLRSGPLAPVQKSQDVIADMTAMIQSLSADFAAEIKIKQDNLDVTQAHLRAATRELSEQRKQIQVWQAHCSELDQVTQRIRNVEHALVDEEKFDWTGRTELDGRDALERAGPAFRRRGQNSTMAGLGGLVDVSFNFDAEPTLPAGDSVASLIRMRRMKMWHVRMEALVRQRLESLRGASAEHKVEKMLDDLVIAVESETQVVDIGRVSGFMQKVRDGVI